GRRNRSAAAHHAAETAQQPSRRSRGTGGPRRAVGPGRAVAPKRARPMTEHTLHAPEAGVHSDTEDSKRGSSAMRSMITGAALGFALLYPLFEVSQARAQAPADIQNPQIEIAYRKPSNPAFQPIHDRLTRLKVLEQFKQFTAP